MAEGMLRSLDAARFDVFSAGTNPSSVNPLAIEAMREIGVDISTHLSKSVDEFIGKEFDYVITVCDNANKNCPVFPSHTSRIHWSFDDPAAIEGSVEERLRAFRRVRDEIRDQLREFVERLRDQNAKSLGDSPSPRRQRTN